MEKELIAEIIEVVALFGILIISMSLMQILRPGVRRIKYITSSTSIMTGHVQDILIIR